MRITFLSFALLFGGLGLNAQTANEHVGKMLEHLRDEDLSEARVLFDGMDKWNQKLLWDELRDEQAAKTFWINLYNATVQLLLSEDPSRFEDRDVFFKREWIFIAGESVSLDLIEHGIIRSSKSKYTLGYTQKLFVGDFEEKFRIEKVDYRIHFALNCGAKSCPPVTFYRATTIDQQLEQSCRSYLEKTVVVDTNQNQVWVPRLCLWFKGDFGGEAGIKDMLTKHEIVNDNDNATEIAYLEYDWTLLIGNYIDL
jgi:hypothetical protein